MPKIPLEIGLQGEQKLKQVETGVYGIARAEDVAARAAKNRVHQQGGGHGGSRGGAGGAHAGFLGTLHSAGRATGGEFGHLAHRGSAIGGLMMAGAAGLGVAAAGLAINALVGHLERLSEEAKATVENFHKIRELRLGAHTEMGAFGTEALGQGAGLKQLLNQGNLENWKAWRARGLNISAESFAGINGSTALAHASEVAQNLGADANAAAGMMKGYSGVKRKDAGSFGKMVAERLLGRSISADEFKNAENLSSSSMGASILKGERLTGLISNKKLNYLSSGVGVLAQENFEAAHPGNAAKQKVIEGMDDLIEKLQASADAIGVVGGAWGTAKEMLGGDLTNESQMANARAFKSQAAASLSAP